MPETWRDIAAAEFAHKAPATTQWAEAVSRNPTALAEGASGAPRLLGTAVARDSEAALPVITVTAADTYVAAQGLGVVEGTLQNNSTANVAARTMTVKAYTGSYRFTASHQTVNSFVSSVLEVYLNGTLEGSWSTVSSGPVQRSIDLNIVPTDVVEWRHRVAGGGETSIFSSPIESGSDAYVEQPLYVQASLK